MEPYGGADPLAVRFVRPGGAGPAGARSLEWRSEGTGRRYVVDERDNYAPAEELEPGAPGYLSFVEGTPVVTRRRTDPPPPPASRPRAAEPPRPPGRARSAGWVWWLLALLVIVLLLARGLRP